jgi:hypothetical protein
MDYIRKKTIYEELIDLQKLIKKESSIRQLCKSLFFIY